MSTVPSGLTYLAPPLLTGFFTLAILVVALVWSRRDFASMLFAIFLTCMALRSFIIFNMRTSPDLHQALLWERAVIIPATAVFVLYYHFTLVYTKTRGQRKILLASYFFFIAVVVIAFTDLGISGMRIEKYGYAPIVGPIAYLFFGVEPLLIIGGAYNLLRHYRISTSVEEKTRLIILAVSVVFPLLGMFLDGFTNLPPVSIWTNLIFVILCTVAILKYRLLDINIFIRKSLVYLVASTVVAIPYVGILFLIMRIIGIKTISWWIPTMMIIFLAIALRPLYSWSQNLIDRLFYGNRYSYLRALEQFSHETRSITKLEELSSSLVKLTAAALGSSSVCLLLPTEDGNALSIASCTGFDTSNLPRPASIGQGALVKWLRSHEDIMSFEELGTIPELNITNHEEMPIINKKEDGLCVPIKIRENELGAILILGDKLNNESYSSMDRQLLATLAGQMAINLENARLYQSEINTRKELERQNNTKTEFLNSITHELKTPLTAILSSSELLSDEESLTSSVRKRLSDNIRQSAYRMNRKVSELLDLARIGAGELTIAPEPIEIGPLITESVTQLDILFKNKVQTLILEIPGSLGKVNADKDRLEQVLSNLLSNANKFSPVGSAIFLRARQAGTRIIVEVEDSAPAVTDEEKKKLFTPYYRGEDVDERAQVPGLGLGLTISKRLIELHQGEIWVESKPERGNIFAFSLPVLDQKIKESDDP